MIGIRKDHSSTKKWGTNLTFLLTGSFHCWVHARCRTHYILAFITFFLTKPPATHSTTRVMKTGFNYKTTDISRSRHCSGFRQARTNRRYLFRLPQSVSHPVLLAYSLYWKNRHSTQTDLRSPSSIEKRRVTADNAPVHNQWSLESRRDHC